MSKGSRKRDADVSEDIVAQNWERIFGKKKLHGTSTKEVNEVVEQGISNDEGLYPKKN